MKNALFFSPYVNTPLCRREIALTRESDQDDIFKPSKAVVCANISAQAEISIGS